MAYFFINAVDPESLDITVATVDGFDLSTVVSTDLTVISPQKRSLSWTWTIGDASPTSLHLLHTFNGSASVVGNYVISGWVVSATTRRRIIPVTIEGRRYV